MPNTTKMNMFGNQTVFSTQANALVTLVSLLSAHFNTGGFTVISNSETQASLVKFQKMTSKLNLPMGFVTDVYSNTLKMMENEAYLILENGDSIFNFSLVTITPPKLIAFLFLSKDESSTLPEFLFELTIPSTTSFFVIKISEDPTGFDTSKNSQLQIKGKCYRLYKPIPKTPLKVFPTMYFGGPDEDQMKWRWETRGMGWNYYRNEIKDMRGINLTLGLVSYLRKDLAIEEYWKKKTSYFWKQLERYLGFRTHIHVEPPIGTGKAYSNTFVYLINNNADALGILPVISSYRHKFLDFVTTGFDSRYNLLVKNPEFVYSWQSMFKPLSPYSWRCLGVAILTMTIILKMVAWKWDCHSLDLSNCFLTIFGFVCCQGSSNIPRNLSGRLICYTSLLFSFSIYQFYTSNFYSILSTKEVSLPFTTLEQFLAKRTHDLYIHPDTALYTRILNAESGILKRLWDEVFQKNSLHQLTTENRPKSLRNVCRGKGAILGQPFQTLYMPNITCKLVTVNSGFFSSNVVTVFRKKFPFKWQFKFVHMRLQEGGISQKFKVHYLGDWKKVAEQTNVTNEPVSLEQVAFLLAISAASFVLSLLILGIEIFTFKSFSKKQERLRFQTSPTNFFPSKIFSLRSRNKLRS